MLACILSEVKFCCSKFFLDESKRLTDVLSVTFGKDGKFGSTKGPVCLGSINLLAELTSSSLVTWLIDDTSCIEYWFLSNGTLMSSNNFLNEIISCSNCGRTAFSFCSDI